jgi:oligoendopeptidase F
MIDIVHLFAHEFGHCVRPFHMSLMEEHKAAKYADVAITAYEMARRIKGGETGDWIAEVICSNNEGE